MYKLLLCLRYLRTRYIALASIVSVMLGVATMIVVNSVMAGFGHEMRDRIHGILADVIVEANDLSGVRDPEFLMARIDQVAGEHVEAMTPTIEIYGMMTLEYMYSGKYITRPVTLIGIDPEGKAKVGPLKEYLDSRRTVVEDGQVVRPPLRPPSAPLDWELTDEAREHRARWRLRARLLMQRAHIPHGPADAAPWEADFGDSDDFTTEPPPFAGSADTLAADAPVEAPRPGDPSADELSAPQDEPATSQGSALAANPFANDPLAAPDAGHNDAETAADLSRPLEGRLYVGANLISYLEEDPETGETHTRMMVQAGDDVRISTVTAGRPPDPTRFHATIVDVFKSGMSEYDSSLVFCNLEYLQKMRGMVDPPPSNVRSITSIQIKLKNYDSAREVVKRLQAAFPPGLFSVRTWEQKQGPLLAAVEVESAILNVLLFLIIAVAGFGILAIFFMIVVEKTRDIGILKALGAGSGGVMSIFLSYGLALGVVGSGVGVVLGLLFVRYINEVEEALTWITGRKVFDEKIYYFPEIPTSVSTWMVIWVALGAMTIAVLASVLPARRAARLHPVQALRYE